MNLVPIIHDIQQRLMRWDDPLSVANDIAHKLNGHLEHMGYPPHLPPMAPGEFKGEMIYEDPHFGFIIVDMNWGARCSTPSHDHGTWGVFAVTTGQVDFTNFASKGQQPELDVLSELHLDTGDVTTLAWPHHDMHKVENRTPHQARSLHIYGKNIGF